MLTVICGEDTTASRQYFISLKDSFRNKNYEIRDIVFEEILEINKWLNDSPSLFFEKRVFFGQGINRKLRADDKRTKEELQRIRDDKNLEFYLWEEVSAYELKIARLATVKEFKPSATIFKLLDSFYPGNKVTFLNMLETVSKNSPEIFVFTMLARLTRNLILVKEKIIPKGMQSWQFYKLQNQAKKWKIERLVLFYESLAKIDLGIKTSSSPFSIKESLDILACYFL